jgi:hypothetical protein
MVFITVLYLLVSCNDLIWIYHYVMHFNICSITFKAFGPFFEYNYYLTILAR